MFSRVDSRRSRMEMEKAKPNSLVCRLRIGTRRSQDSPRFPIRADRLSSTSRVVRTCAAKGAGDGKMRSAALHGAPLCIRMHHHWELNEQSQNFDSNSTRENSERD